MSMNWAPNNHNYVPAYQASGIPFTTASLDNEVTDTPHRIRFPYVTRWISVGSEGAGDGFLRLGFTENGVNGPLPGAYHPTGSNANYFLLPNDGRSVRFEIQCTEIWLRADDEAGTDDSTQFSVMAGYTNIPVTQALTLTGSLEFQGVG